MGLQPEKTRVNHVYGNVIFDKLLHVLENCSFISVLRGLGTLQLQRMSARLLLLYEGSSLVRLNSSRADL